MPCEILTTTDGRAVLTDSNANWAFGPVFESFEEAEEFCQWLGWDPRNLMVQAILAGQDPDTALERRYTDWRIERQRPAAQAPLAKAA